MLRTYCCWESAASTFGGCRDVFKHIHPLRTQHDSIGLSYASRSDGKRLLHKGCCKARLRCLRQPADGEQLLLLYGQVGFNHTTTSSCLACTGLCGAMPDIAFQSPGSPFALSDAGRALITFLGDLIKREVRAVTSVVLAHLLLASTVACCFSAVRGTASAEPRDMNLSNGDAAQDATHTKMGQAELGTACGKH